MMNISMSDQIVRLAFEPSVRRAVQDLPQHQPIQSDDRFNALLDRLAQSERESRAAASIPLDVSPSLVER